MESSKDSDSLKNSREEEKIIMSIRRWDLKLKTVIFIICLSGFSYQMHLFLRHYYSFPTVMEVDVEFNKEYVVPAITYCFFQSATLNSFCTKNANNCHVPTEEECKLYPEYCKNEYVLPNIEALEELKNGTLEDFRDHFLNVSDFRVVNPWNIDDVTGPHLSLRWYSFNVSECFTLNSLLNSSKEAVKWKNENPRQDSYDPDLYYVGQIQFELQYIKHKHYNISHSISFTLHSPFELSQPVREQALKPNSRYQLVFKMEEVNRLPIPYSKMDCINYTSEWLERNRTGPRSQKACRDLCEIRYDLACYGCVNGWNMYPINEAKCINGFNEDPDKVCDSTLRDEYYKCTSDCKLECSKTTYTYNINEIDKDPWDFRGFREDLIEIDVFLDSQTKVYNYRKKFQYVELFSNIGGYLGIWLGISLFALIDIIIGVYNTIRPLLKKYEEKKKFKKEKNSEETLEEK